MSFLPENYKEPITENYMRFQDGKNTFRVLSPAIVGFEYWVTEIKDKQEVRKPVRKHIDERIPQGELGIDKWGNPEYPKHFWAFVVYNRQAEKIQILEITQKKVIRGIKSLVDDEDWGDPKEYDITVTKSGEKLDTDYVVQGKPNKTKVDEAILKEYEEMKIDLEQLFIGGDPFGEKTETQTTVSATSDEEIDIENIPF